MALWSGTLRISRDLDPQFVNSLSHATSKPIKSRLPVRSDYENYLGGGLDTDLFTSLRSINRQRRNWLLLYLLGLVYLLLLFPGGFILGREKDYRFAMGGLAGVVAVFSLAFHLVGGRDLDEPMIVRSVAVARPLPGERLDVMQWSDAAVVRGDIYTFAHRGAGRLYSATQRIRNRSRHDSGGDQGALHVEIPHYSSRTFVHRTTLKAKSPTPEIVDFLSVGGQLQTLSVRTSARQSAGQVRLRLVRRSPLQPLPRGGRAETSRRGTVAIVSLPLRRLRPIPAQTTLF